MVHYIDLSDDLKQRIIHDRTLHWVNPYACKDEAVIRRNMKHDRANLWRPAFVRDVEKIMHIPYYNRYSDKTQVFSLYRNDDISRRAQHVQLVSRIARNIGNVLGLNTDLIEAISLGHDIGHTPFGHAGERKLDEIYFKQTNRHFYHNIQSARVLDKIFNRNISLQTLDGIICHNGELELKEYRPIRYYDFDTYDKKVESCLINPQANKKLVPSTLEGCVMRIADIIAYLGKDRQDAIKIGLINDNTIFLEGKIGTTNAEIINNMTVNIIENSYGKDCIEMDKEYFEAFSKGKQENYKLIYGNTEIAKLYKNQIEPMFEQIYYRLLDDLENHRTTSVIYKHHINYIKEMTKYYSNGEDIETQIVKDPDTVIVDYIASMTDDYFIDLYKYLFPGDHLNIEYKGYFTNM